MIEETVLNYLCRRFPAYPEMPEEYAPPLVLVEKTGGGEENHIARATVAVQSYGESLFDAARLNAEVKAFMRRIAELDEIVRVSLNSDYNYTDEETKRYCYQAVFDLAYYEGGQLWETR